MDTLLRRMENELKLRNLSMRTRKSYLQTLSAYFSFKGSHCEKADEESIRRYIIQKLEKGAAGQTPNVHFAKKESRLPIVLSRTDIRYVQALLGHANIRTTQRYTQVTNPALKNIKSPLSCVPL